MAENFEIKVSEDALEATLKKNGSCTIFNLDRKVRKITHWVNDTEVA